MQWGFSTGGHVPLLDEAVEFHGLVGTAPSLASTSNYLDTGGNLLVNAGAFNVVAPFEFTGFTTTFRFGLPLPPGIDILSLRQYCKSPGVVQDVTVMQLVAVPEPTSLASAVVGGLLALRRRR